MVGSQSVASSHQVKIIMMELSLEKLIVGVAVTISQMLIHLNG
jgi:hypothetical protein